MDPREAEPHLSSELVARYLDRTVSDAERAAVVAHLADCPDCRRELAELQATLRRAGARGGWWKVAVPAAAAAAVLVLLFRAPVQQPLPPDAELRDPARTDSGVVVPRRPLGPARLPVELVWSLLPDAEEYRVTVFDEEGTIVYHVVTGDTGAMLPDTLKLSPGAPYFWRVDATLRGGEQGRGPTVRFTVPDTARQ
ncbi:MAG TPA: zf-HC2 domain-containing protein, partial [Gemmatimonadales bacterium]|nr:zf-HC2 domain-containing protein [Gemmatimonadales bacterium]